MGNRELREAVRKIALLNALTHGGKAREGSVMGKLLAQRPELKAKAREIVSLVSEVVQEVNRLSPAEQRRILEERWPESLRRERVVEEKRLPPLPNVEKYERVVTRFSPNPDCVLHLGSARAIVLCYEYAKIHGGLFYLRFEDTDPKLKRPALEFYDSIRQDLLWLGCRWDAEFIQSDRLPIYYEHAERLLKKGKAYVCTCKREDFRELVAASQPCPCRDLPPEEHVARWRGMHDGTYREGKAVVRVKTDLNHPNPAVRDWPALRIIDTERYPHPRLGSKYRVWPLYNFACGIDDHLLGVTHIIRGKEHLTNQKRQEYMYRHFGWRYPEAIHYGRLKIKGAFLSKSKIIQGIQDGTFKGWEDPRLATLAALRRRGITPEAIRKLMIDVGPKTTDVVLSWENLYAYNRKVVDPRANRYFFVNKPVQITVTNIPRPFTARLRLHPDYPERGERLFRIHPRRGQALFWVSEDDAELFKRGDVLRFMGLFNIRVEEAERYAFKAAYHSESYEEAKRLNAPLIHWIPIGADVPCVVVMPDATVAEGIAEKSCKGLSAGAIIQFERFGFVRVDEVNEKVVAYYAHR